MKKYTISELQDIANKLYFTSNSDVDTMLATEDGNFFYPEASNHAIAHAKNSKVHIVTKGGNADVKHDVSEKQAEAKQVKTGKPAPLTKKEALLAIKNAKTETELDELDKIHGLCDSSDDEISKAFELKENTFL
jgi:hypothetical protein